MRIQSRFGWLVLSAVMVGAILLASCSVFPSEGPTAPAAPESASTTTKPYGSLTVTTDFGGHLDPQVGSSPVTRVMGNAVFDSLVNYIGDNKLMPGIAERWEISADGKAHTFYIRKGVKFHNGDELTGADVKFSIERMMAPEVINADAPSWRSAVASVDLKDDYTVVLRLKQPQYEWLRGYDNAMTAVVPKKYIEEKGVDYFRKNYVGSGPFKVVSFVPGTRLELEAVENHWRTVPKFKNLTILTVSEESTKVAMLKTGEVDLAEIAPDSLPGLKAAGLRIVSYDGGAQVYGFLFYDMANPDKYAFGDVRVRKALQLGIDSKEIATKMLGGYGGPYYLFGIDEFGYYADPNVMKPDPYDPEGAKKLLAEAGYANGFTTKIYDVGKGGLSSQMALAVSGYWRKLGINAELVPMELVRVQQLYRPKHTPDIWNTLYMDRGSTARDFEKVNSYHSKTGFLQNTNVPRLDELIVKVPSMPMSDEKKRLALEAVVLAKKEYTSLAVVAPHNILAVGPKIGNVSPIRNSFIMALMFETITHAK